MAYRKLNLDRDKIDTCRQLANRISAPVQRYINRHSSIGIERTSLEFIGLSTDTTNALIKQLSKDNLRLGTLFWVFKAILTLNITCDELQKKIQQHTIDWNALPDISFDKIRKQSIAHVKKCMIALKKNRPRIDSANKFSPTPLRLTPIIVTDGTLPTSHMDAAVFHGADIILIQISHLHPIYQTSCNNQSYFKLIADHIQCLSKQYHRPISLAYDFSGPVMPEIILNAISSGAQGIFSDILSNSLHKNIHIKRDLIDQYMSRLLCAVFGRHLYTDDAYLAANSSSFRNAHQSLAANFLNESFATHSHISADKIGFTHAFDCHMELEDHLLYELAHAQMIREIFPKSPTQYIPAPKMIQNPTDSQHLYTLYTLVSMITEQSTQWAVLPHHQGSNAMVHDMKTSAHIANRTFHYAKHIGDEIAFSSNGIVARRASTVLENTHRVLKRLDSFGFIDAISRGMLTETNYSDNQSLGASGIFEKHRHYFNPVLTTMISEITDHG